MAQANLHIIKKQVLDVETDFSGNTYELQNNIRDLFYTKMLPVIEEACNHYDSGDIIRIDKLTIDVGEVSLKGIDEELTRRFEAKLHEQLSKLFYKEKGSEFSQTETTIEQISANMSDLELIMSFLKTGVLPWWKGNTKPVNPEKIFLEQIRKNPVVMKKFISSQTQNKQLLKRIVLQFSEMITEQIITLYRDTQTPGINKFITKLKRLLLNAVDSESLNSSIVYALRQELILVYAENIPVALTEKKVITRFIKILETADSSDKKSIKKLFRITGFPTPEEKKEYGVVFLKELKQQIIQLQPDVAAEIFTPGKKVTDLTEKEKLKKESRSDKKQTEAKQAQEQKENESSDAEEKKMTEKTGKSELTERYRMNMPEELYIKNSGLVLIWSYLPHYFKHVGLLTDSMFTDEQAKHRAAHLLQYLVTGETTSPEYELPLNKILCGIPVEEPLETGITITESEAAEAERMLQTVIDHWGGLGKSSPLALRQTFLNRNGVLLAENDSWILRVQDSGIDILLDKIPWSYSIIHLKWMEKPIYVEWQ